MNAFLLVLFIAASILIPFTGCVLAVQYHEPLWLWLLIPLIIYHEAGIFVMILAFIITASIAGF